MVRQQLYYSADQVAELLGLHPKTVRTHIRNGRLKASRVGRQYRISHEDLAEFTGGSAPSAASPARHAEVSAIVQIDAVGTEAAIRLTNTVMATIHGQRPEGGRLRVETVYDEERAALKIIVLGGLDVTADLLKVIDTLIEDHE
ncbi:helix-turn-helix domain-containing protein [Streptomyces paludis]|uniref:DNA-binding protein n=1 Tax=Streptomyces paludis TaxID=2282738 RepID=A0A345HU75_9ACTN|nr:helix-turn-helix domain-containing protein [Streptomyces paludis]AXG80249.1 DNA-binding protein [Streptomyces paludis]